MRFRTWFLVLVVSIFVLGTGFADAQRRGGSFGGGRSFGGGGFGGGGRSFGGGGSFGGGRSFGGSSGGSSFGGGNRSFGGNNSTRSGGSFTGSAAGRGTSSFSRSGSFGSSGYVSSTSVRPSYSYSRPSYVQGNYYYGGVYGPAYHYGYWSDWSYSWMHPAWYYWMPFHPAFYYSPPVYYNGGYYPGEFSWFRFLLGIAIIVFVIWLIARLFRGGGRGRRLKYTTYE